MTHWKHVDRWHSAAKRPKNRARRRARHFVQAMKHAQEQP